MTREEQRKEASYEFATKFGGKDPTMMEIVALWFRRGAKWSDEHPKEGLVDIDKACDWLSNVSIEDMSYKYNDFDTSEGWYKFIEDFRKAMKE